MYFLLDYDECDTWGTCDQSCELVNRVHQCSCNAGYQLYDQHTCKAENSKQIKQ